MQSILRRLHPWGHRLGGRLLATLVGLAVAVAHSRAAEVDAWMPVNPSPVSDSDPLYGVAANGTEFVAVGTAGNIRTSPDGTAWANQTTVATDDLYATAWNGNLFVAVGSSHASNPAYPVILTSPDGAAWTSQAAGAAPANLYGVAVGGNLVVAVGSAYNTTTNLDYPVILTSPDGVAWTSQAPPGVGELYGVAWDGRQFVAVGGYFDPVAQVVIPIILTSPDGVAWSGLVPGFEQGNLYAVAWCGQQFVAVGSFYDAVAQTVSPVIVSSADGATWVRHDAISANAQLYGVTWTGQQAVAVGVSYAPGTQSQHPLILASPDAATWTSSDTGTGTGLLNAVTRSGSQLVAVGDLVIVGAIHSAIPPSIVLPPVNQTILVGKNVTFAVTAGGTGPFTYQWRKNGTNIPGATSPTFTLKKVTTGNAAKYDVVVKGPGGSATSNPVKLTVLKTATKVKITTKPAAVTVKSGKTAKFTVKATGTAPLLYQWQKNNANLANAGNLSGATTAKLTIAHAAKSDAGKYRVLVTNPAGQATSPAVKLTVK